MLKVDRDEALEVADKLRRSVAEGPIEHGETQPDGKVISVGAATLPHDASERAKLVDWTPFASKRGGGSKAPLQARHGERRGRASAGARAVGRTRGAQALKVDRDEALGCGAASPIEHGKTEPGRKVTPP